VQKLSRPIRHFVLGLDKFGVALMKYFVVSCASILCLASTPALAADPAFTTVGLTADAPVVDHGKTYAAVISQAKELGGLNEGNLRYALLFQLVSMDLDAEATVSMLQNLRAVASTKDDTTFVRVVDELLLANADENSDVAAILSKRLGLPPVPTPPAVKFQNPASADY